MKTILFYLLCALCVFGTLNTALAGGNGCNEVIVEDVDRDGVVVATDILQVLAVAVSAAPPTVENLAACRGGGGGCIAVTLEDVNFDGIVTAVDALQVANVATFVEAPTVLNFVSCRRENDSGHIEGKPAQIAEHREACADNDEGCAQRTDHRFADLGKRGVRTTLVERRTLE